jgi:GxxExxY protein
MEFEELSNKVIGCAIEVHQTLGPGLLENIYEQCLAQELNLAGIYFTQQAALPVHYKGLQLSCGYRADFLFPSELILEIKSVRQLEPISQAQILTYMKLAKVPVGLLINFNVKLLKDGIKRFVI